MSYNRAKIKQDSKQLLDNHYPWFLQLFLPYFICILLTGPLLLCCGLGILTGWLSYFLLLGTEFTILNIIRTKKFMYDHQNPWQSSLTAFQTGDLFIHLFLLNILTSLFTSLWTCLFVIPGIVKSYAYHQAPYIYYDAYYHGIRLGTLQAITKSRKLMQYHKGQLFIFDLSYLGWDMLLPLTGYILSIWLVPYKQIAYTNYYQYLQDNDKNFKLDP